MKFSKHFLCFILSVITAVSLLAGCSGDPETSELLLDSSKESRDVAKNRDELNSILKSWEIFLEAAHGSSTEMESVTMTDAVKTAIESEADNKRIDLSFCCPADEADTYRSIIGEFRWLYANDDKYRLNISIIPENSADSSSGADIFFFEDRELAAAVAAGSLSGINDELGVITSKNNTKESMSALTLEGRLYGFPVSSARGGLLVYDKTVFSEDITSLEEMIEKAGKLKKSVLFALEDPVCSAQVFMSAGCRLESAEEAQYIEYNTRQGLAAAKTINDLAALQGKGLIAAGGKKEILEGFASGSLCAAVTDEATVHELLRSPTGERLSIDRLPAVRISGEDRQLHSFAGYRAVGVDPRSRFPFTAQLLAYYISNERSQMAAYYSLGYIPAVGISEYSDIAEDHLYTVMSSQKDCQHIFSETTGEAFFKEMENKNIGKNIVDMKGRATEDDLVRMLSEIKLMIPAAHSQ